MSFLQSNQTSGNFRSISLSGSNGIAGSNSDLGMYYTTNSGQTWTRSADSFGNPISGNFNVALSGSNGIAGGSTNGTPRYRSMWYSLNGGRLWTQANRNNGEAWLALAINGLIGIAGSAGISSAPTSGIGIIYTTNGGVTWSNSSQITGIFSSIDLSGSNAIAGSGSNLGIYYSTNSGQTWAQSNITSGNFNAVSLSGSNGIAGSYSNLGIYYTTNSGQTWTQSNQTTGSFNTISLSGSNGIAGSSSNAGLYYTTNSGQTWSQTNITTGSFFLKSISLSGSNGMAANIGIYSTLNAGQTWTLSNINSGSFLSVSMDPSSLRGIAGSTSNLGIYYSSGPVSTIIQANGETQIIYFKYINDPSGLGIGVFYKINDSSYYSFSLPVTIVNTNTNYTLKVLFENDIILNSNIWYFICGSNNIQYGSTSLKTNGEKIVITIDSSINYPGLIQNGTISSSGFSNIYVFNLQITAINGSRQPSDAGWIGQSYFGKDSSNNYIVNCSSIGQIIDGGGGIIGGYSGSGNGAKLYITGCSSSGNTGNYSGGIIGFFAGQNGGEVICESCWSTGVIGVQSGGIIGYKAAFNNGYVKAINCYSTGQLDTLAGGIFGEGAGDGGTTDATNCYCQGNITDFVYSGGIYGNLAGENSGSCIATNCYSSEYESGNNGIFSQGSNGTTRIQNNCYAANGNWSNTLANSNLTGIPNPIIGTTWVGNPLLIDYPYELYNMGYTPYTITNIIFEVGSPPILNNSYSQTILSGQSTIAAIRPSYSYDIYRKSGGDPTSYNTITMNDNTGVITTTNSTIPGTYIITLRNTGSYNITTYNLTVLPRIPCLTENTMVLTPTGYKNITKLKKGELVTTSDNRNVEIILIFNSNITGNINTYPCKIIKDSIGPDYPKEDFLISRNHLIKYKNYWIYPMKYFPLEKKQGIIKYYHIVLPNYLKDNLVINNGVVVESLINHKSLSIKNEKLSKYKIEYKKRKNSIKKFPEEEKKLEKYK
jgi:hypothetical protein